MRGRGRRVRDLQGGDLIVAIDLIITTIHHLTGIVSAIITATITGIIANGRAVENGITTTAVTITTAVVATINITRNGTNMTTTITDLPAAEVLPVEEREADPAGIKKEFLIIKKLNQSCNPKF